MDLSANPDSSADSRTTPFLNSHSNGRRTTVLCLLLAAATFAIYSPIIRAPFLNYDDALHVSENAHTRAGLTWNTVKWAFTTNETSDWHPVTWLSHALDCQMFGLSPGGPHAVNLLLHIANALILFLLLRAGTGSVWRSFAVAAIFALHPINVESVAWISERKDVLSMFFFLLALAAYGRYARRSTAISYLAVTIFYALALMSKAQVITFPFALLLLDYWPLRRMTLPGSDVSDDAELHPLPNRSIACLVAEKIPWFALSTASAFMTMHAETEAMQAKYPLWVRLGNAAIAYARYLGKAVYPVHLAPLYPHPGSSISRAGALAAAIFILAVSAIALAYHRNRPLFVGWFWFLGTLVPMIGLVQISVHSMADRYAYIPLIGVFVVLVWGAGDLIVRFHLPRIVSWAVAGGVLVVLGSLLSLQLYYWGDNVRLWSHTIAITEGNYTAEDMLATALLAEGRIDEGVSHLRQALVYYPDDAMATLNLATYDQMTGNYASALRGYEKVPHYSRNPGLIEQALINSGYAYMSLKQFENARGAFTAALQSQPANPDGYRGLGLAEQRAGNVAPALRYYQIAFQLRPDVTNLLLIAQAEALAGQSEAAQAAQSQAARLSPNISDENATVQRLLTE